MKKKVEGFRDFAFSKHTTNSRGTPRRQYEKPFATVPVTFASVSLNVRHSSLPDVFLQFHADAAFPSPFPHAGAPASRPIRPDG